MSRNRKENTGASRMKRQILPGIAPALLLLALAVFFFYSATHGKLILTDASDGTVYGSFNVKAGDSFSIGFIHSVNKSPLIDYYRIQRDGIYVEKTVYYGFGAGVETELSEGESLSYGDDGSMIITGFNKKIEPLSYIVGTVSDHTLRINDGEEISLRELCGRNSRVLFTFKPILSF